MELYSYYRSSTSYRIRIALNLKGLNFDVRSVNLKDGEHLSTPFSRVSSYRSLPVLLAGEEPLFQSLAILDWLDENFPAPPLLPHERRAKQICREFYYAIATEIHAPNNLSVLKYLSAEFSADPTAIESWYQTWIHRTFEPIEHELSKFEWASDSLPFGFPTLFEIVLVPQIYNARRWKTDLTAFPLLTRVDEKCAEHKAFIDAHPDNQPDAPKDEL